MVPPENVIQLLERNRDVEVSTLVFLFRSSRLSWVIVCSYDQYVNGAFALPLPIVHITDKLAVACTALVVRSFMNRNSLKN